MGMRILWISDCPLLASGFARVGRELTLRLCREPGIELAFLGWGYDGWPYDPSSYPVRIYPSAANCFGSDTFERVVAEFRPHVVVTLGEIWMFQWLRSHPARGQFRWVAYFPIDGGPFYPPWEPLLREIDEVVAMSEFGREVLSAGVPSKRIHCIHHGVDPAVFRPLPNRGELRQHPRFRDKFIIGCVARNQPRKNIPALVKAFAVLAKELPSAHLYLHMNPCDVGFDIVTLLRRHRLQERADVATPELTLSGFPDDVELNRIYNLFDITALPSNGEGFGLPIIESLAAGVPVVATDYSACPELVRGHGELARIHTTQTLGNNLIEHAVVDVEDLARCMRLLHDTPELRAKYSQAGRRFAEGLAWELLVPRWLELLRMVGNHP